MSDEETKFSIPKKEVLSIDKMSRMTPSRSRSGSIQRRASSRSPSFESEKYSRKISYKSDRGGSSKRKSRSRSPISKRHHSRSYSRDRSYSRSHRHKSKSHSPMSSRRRHVGTRDHPKPSRCLGIFGLSTITSENSLQDIFERYGAVERVTIVFDKKTGRSRGFGFIYFKSSDDAEAAKEACSGMEIDGKSIRVDFSITKRAHTPTPGIYMGKLNDYDDRKSSSRRYDRDDEYYRDDYRSRDRHHKSSYRESRHESRSSRYR